MRRLGLCGAIALAFLAGCAAAPPQAPGSEDGGTNGCAAVVALAAGMIGAPERYMDAPRAGDVAKNEPTVVWAEVDHFVVNGHDRTPVYRAYTLMGLLRRLDYAVPADDPAAPAFREGMEAIATAWSAWSDGDGSKPVPYGASRSIMASAADWCDANGRADLPLPTAVAGGPG